MEEKKHSHLGHRLRLRNLISKIGIENLNEHQALEFTLYYIHPRCDTNEIAHDLLNKFGDYHSVLEASVEDLMCVKKMGRASSQMLSLMRDVMQYYRTNRCKDIKRLNNIQEIIDYFCNLLELKDKMECYVVALNLKNEVIAHKKVATVKDENLTVTKSCLTDFAMTNKVKKILIGHNHPKESCSPSISDDDATNIMKDWLNDVGIELVDHIIIGDDGAFSFRNCKMYPIKL